MDGSVVSAASAFDTVKQKSRAVAMAIEQERHLSRCAADTFGKIGTIVDTVSSNKP